MSEKENHKRKFKEVSERERERVGEKENREREREKVGIEGKGEREWDRESGDIEIVGIETDRELDGEREYKL